MVQEPGGYIFSDYPYFGVPKSLWNLVFQTISLAAYPVWYVNLIVSIGALFVVAFFLDKYREWKRERALRADVSVGDSSDNGLDNKADGKVVDVRVAA